jgi:hypothetical protein
VVIVAAELTCRLGRWPLAKRLEFVVIAIEQINSTCLIEKATEQGHGSTVPVNNCEWQGVVRSTSNRRKEQPRLHAVILQLQARPAQEAEVTRCKGRLQLPLARAPSGDQFIFNRWLKWLV